MDIKGTAQNTITGTDTFDFSEVGTVEADDFLLVFFFIAGNSSITYTITDNIGGSWTKIDHSFWGNFTVQAYYKVASGGERNFTTNCTSSVRFGIINHDGVDTVNPIDSSNWSRSTSNWFRGYSNSITTTSDNCLMYEAVSAGTGTNSIYCGGGRRIFADSDNLVCYRQPTAGPSNGAGFSWTDTSSSDTGGQCILALKDASPSSPSSYPTVPEGDFLYSSRKASSSDLIQWTSTNLHSSMGYRPMHRTQLADATFDSSSDVNVSTNEITLTSHGYGNYNIVRYLDDGGTTITGLTDGDLYAVKVVDDNTVTLRAYSNSSRLDTASDVSLTVVGSGTHRFIDVGISDKASSSTSIKAVARVAYPPHVALCSFKEFDTEDLTGKRFYFRVYDTSSIRAGSGLYGGLLDTSNNLRTWKLSDFFTYPKNMGESQFYIFDPSDTSQCIVNDPSFSVSAVSKFVVGVVGGNENVYRPGISVGYGDFGVSELPIIVGGSSSNPSSIAVAQRCKSEASKQQGGSQVYLITGFQVGDGSTPTYFEAFRSIEFQPVNNGVDNYTAMNIPTSQMGIIVNLGNASDAFILRYASGSLRGSYFVIDSGSNSSAIYDIDSNIFTNYTTFTLRSFVTANGFSLYDSSGITLNGATLNNVLFSRDDIVDIGSGDLDACTVNDSISTTHAVLATAGGSLINGTLIKGDEEYGLRLDGAAGVYDLSGQGFSGYATNKDIDITATTGTWTITINAGQSQPSHTSAGANVVFSQPLSSIVLNNLVSGSEARIYETGTTIEIDGVESSTTSFSTTTSEASVDIVIFNTLYQPIRLVNIAVGTGLTLPIQQIFDRNYTNP